MRMHCERSRRHTMPGESVPWTLSSYPHRAWDDLRTYVPTTERLLTKDGMLAYAVGHDHPVTEEPTLLTETEYLG